VIGDDPIGPVAESVDAGAVHRSLSWFKSRPGLQPSLLTQLRLGKPAPAPRLPASDCRLPRHGANSGLAAP
jgi:hypothetical protein